MKKIYLLALIISILFHNNLYSQNIYEITGQIKDKTTNENLAFCNVILLKEKKQIAGGISDKDGYFYLKANKGKYKIVISFMGYKTDTIATGFIKSNKFIGVFKLIPATNQLNEVTIKTSNIVKNIDRDVIYITDKVRKNAVETGDVLEKINGITYDRFNGTIKVDNNPNVKLLINNLDKDPDYIKNLDPKKIKKVEIIRYPSGKYGLKNYATVINIITFKNYVGYNVNLNDMAVFDMKTAKNFFPINQLNAQLDYTHNNVNYYIQVSNQINNINTNYDAVYKTNSLSIVDKPVNNSEKNRKSKYSNNKLVLGADWYINPRNTFSYEFGLNYPVKTSSELKSQISFYDANNLLTKQENFYKNLSRKNKSLRNSIFYHGIIDQNNNIDASYSFTSSSNTFEQNTLIESDNHFLFNNGKSQSSELNIEYNHIINKQFSYNLGYDNIYNSNSYYYNNDNDNRVDYHLSNLKNNAYANISWNINRKSGLKIGLAYELYSLKHKKTKNYHSIQPFFNYRYLINKHTSLRLSYTVSSTYPQDEQTTPYTTYINNNIIKIGNPLLSPSYLHRINTNFSFFNNKLSIIPYFYFSKNYISIFTRQINNNQLAYSYKNFDYFNKKGIKLNLNFSLFKYKLYVSSGLDFSRSYIEYQSQNNDINNFTLNGDLYYTDYKSKLMFFIDFKKNIYKTINLNGYHMENMDYSMIGVRKVFLKNKLSLMLMYIPPIDFGLQYQRTNTFRTDSIVSIENLDLNIIKNFFFIKLNYKFGNGHNVRKIIKKEFEKPSSKKGIL